MCAAYFSVRTALHTFKNNFKFNLTPTPRQNRMLLEHLQATHMKRTRTDSNLIVKLHKTSSRRSAITPRFVVCCPPSPWTETLYPCVESQPNAASRTNLALESSVLDWPYVHKPSSVSAGCSLQVVPEAGICAAGCLAASRGWRHTNWLYTSATTPWIQRDKHKLTIYVKQEQNSWEANTNWLYTSNMINYSYCYSTNLKLNLKFNTGW